MEEEGEGEKSEGGEVKKESGSEERAAGRETESEGRGNSVAEAESEEVAAVTGDASSSQETRFSAPGDGRDSRQGNNATPVTPGRDMPSPLLPSSKRCDMTSPVPPSIRHDMTSPMEPSLMISPSFGIQRPNSTDNSFGFRMDSDNLQDAQCSHEVSCKTDHVR